MQHTHSAERIVRNNVRVCVDDFGLQWTGTRLADTRALQSAMVGWEEEMQGLALSMRMLTKPF